MKKFISLLTVVALLCSLPLFASAEEEITFSLEVTPPDQLFYTVGEEPSFEGGIALYTAQTEYRFPLNRANCEGFDTSSVGYKTVTVHVHGLTDTFGIMVLSEEEPIYKMKDINKNLWPYAYFGPCMKAGFFAGDDAGNLNPFKPITRAEMATILYRAYKDRPGAMEADSIADPFPDVAVDAWFYESVEACRRAGILRGTDEGLCNPFQPIRRQDAILMLMRIQYTDEEMNAMDLGEKLRETGMNPSDLGQISPYALPAITAALGDVIKGDDNGNINPQGSITRAECAAIFCRLLLAGYEWTPAVEMPLIYLSPSNQFDNSYAGGITTEGRQMTVLATRVKELLEAKGYRVVLAAGDRKIDDRSADANAMGADLYIPIHSNAGGNQTGTYVFYNGSIQGCKEFSREIFDRVAALTGTPYSTSRHKEDYLCLLPDGAPFREIKNPTMPMAYIEVEFHDKAEKAQWIVNNNEALAKAIADGVVAYAEKYLLGA